MAQCPFTDAVASLRAMNPMTAARITALAVRDIIPNDTGRFGKPEEIAAAVAYLSSPLADYVSGANLRVDGGLIRNVN